MRRSLTAFSLSLLIALSLVGQASAAKAKKCAIKGATDFIILGQTKVLVKQGKHGDKTFYGCLNSSKKVVNLGVSRTQGKRKITTFDFAIAGNFIGFQRVTFSKAGDKLIQVFVADLKSGRTKKVDTAASKADLGGRVSDLALDSSGTIAWLYADDLTKVVRLYNGVGAVTVYTALPTDKVKQLKLKTEGSGATTKFDVIFFLNDQRQEVVL